MGGAIAFLVTRYPKTLLFVITLVSMLKACNPQVKVDLNQLVDQVLEYAQQSELREPAPEGDQQHIEQEKAASDTGHSEKQDRITQKKAPSIRRRDVYKQRRSALRLRRKQFPRRNRN